VTFGYQQFGCHRYGVRTPVWCQDISLSFDENRYSASGSRIYENNHSITEKQDGFMLENDGFSTEIEAGFMQGIISKRKNVMMKTMPPSLK